MTFTAMAPTYGGAREYGRKPFGRFGLGQTPEVYTVTGDVSYHDGSQTTEDSQHRVRVENLEAWKANYNASGGGSDYDRDVVELWRKDFSCQGPLDPPGGVPCVMVALGYVTRNERVDGSAGWQVYVPQLIHLPEGGVNPGYLLLEGDVSYLQPGPMTIRGVYPGTRPNDLYFGSPWSFQVMPDAPPPDPDVEELTGSVTDSDEMVELRLQSIAVIEGEKSAAAARVMHEEGYTPESRAAYEATRTPDPDQDEGEEPPTGEPPPSVLKAGISPGVMAAMAAAAMLFIPTKRSGRPGGGFG